MDKTTGRRRTKTYLGWACEEDHRDRFTSITHEELPIHYVRIGSAFALSKFTVTMSCNLRCYALKSRLQFILEAR